MRTKMLLGHIGRHFIRHRPLQITWVADSKWFSSNHKYITVEQDSELENVAIVKMNKKPVNSLCLDHLQELTATFEDLAKDKGYKAAILTSGLPGVFSAGLDILSMYGRTYDEIYAFWSSLQKTWITLYANPLITVAAINGNSPAGGCLLALSCDHRVMADEKYSIGLNESKVGIVAPVWLKNMMQNVIGFRETEKALQEGKLFSPSQAKEVGLVDEVTPMDEVIPSCRDFIQEYLKIPYTPRYLTKQMMRQDTIKQVDLHQDASFTANFLLQDGVQKSIGKYVQALHNKKK